MSTETTTRYVIFDAGTKQYFGPKSFLTRTS